MKQSFFVIRDNGIKEKQGDKEQSRENRIGCVLRNNQRWQPPVDQTKGAYLNED